MCVREKLCVRTRVEGLLGTADEEAEEAAEDDELGEAYAELGPARHIVDAIEDDERRDAEQGVGLQLAEGVCKRRAKEARGGASLRERSPLLTYPWAWKAKPAKGYIDKEMPLGPSLIPKG